MSVLHRTRHRSSLQVLLAGFDSEWVDDSFSQAAVAREIESHFERLLDRGQLKVRVDAIKGRFMPRRRANSATSLGSARACDGVESDCARAPCGASGQAEVSPASRVDIADCSRSSLVSDGNIVPELARFSNYTGVITKIFFFLT